MSDPSDRLEDVARRNPNINPDRIRRYTQLTQRLQERGLWRRPAFNIDHPFATPRPSTSKRFAVYALPESHRCRTSRDRGSYARRTRARKASGSTGPEVTELLSD